jgi:hypothetical protein
MKDGKITTLDWPKLQALVNICCVNIKLHKADGFGCILAEAMLLSGSVVAARL